MVSSELHKRNERVDSQFKLTFHAQTDANSITMLNENAMLSEDRGLPSLMIFIT